ncbi:MAG: succinyl-diaminopimelate desuccinylase [Myxococcota bacterium]
MDFVDLTRALLRCPSVTPSDAGALEVVERALTALGFTCERLTYGDADERVDNLYARRGTSGPNFCFAGHTDVVPAGDERAWSHGPFAGELVDGHLIGRGAVDMKGAIAAFIGAVAEAPTPASGSVSLLITGDEEGRAIHGTRPVLQTLAARGERIDACLVGEPTSRGWVGSAIKVGRRGSFNAVLTVEGVQGHVAYPELADNPVHRLTRLAHALVATPLDQGTKHFAPSSLQLTSVDVGNPATNVIPARATARFNVRFNDTFTPESLEARIRETLDAVDPRYTLVASVSGGGAFVTTGGPLLDVVQRAVRDVTGRAAELSTSGGTSDARFIRAYAPVVELGLAGESMHKVNEQVSVADLETLKRIYSRTLEHFFGAP